jgi:hypothetical protein
MIVVVTGMVGVDKKSYLQKVCQFAAARGKEVQDSGRADEAS